MSVSPRDLILQGTWHHALFTTYSLSLSFFESQLWCGGLKKRGCREAWVIADIDGYSASLSERQSRFVGHDYRLVSVALGHGVFHPKCSFFSGPDGALLLIGSGNLTFGGHGRNIEVMEGFRSAEHPAVFAEFADFLVSLQKRTETDFLNPDPAWLLRFEMLARRAAGNATPSPSPSLRLLHSTQQSILDQVALASAPLGPLREARILSPFFGPTADAVFKLVDRLRPARVRIALPPHEKEKTSFPFNRLPTGVSVEAAKVTVEKPSRKLHAKWIELDFASGHRLTLTGSVNATRQALCTTNNIEVGILRTAADPGGSPLQWQDTAPPTDVQEHDFDKAGLGKRALLHARINESGNLTGCVLGPHGASARWIASLDVPDGTSLDFEVATNAAGHFAHQLSSSDRIEERPGLQLHLSQGELHARCWVQNDWLIEMADLGVSFACNILRGDASEEDEIGFLSSLHESIAEIAPALAAHHAARAAAYEDAPRQTRPEHVVPLSALAPVEEHDATALGSDLVHGATTRRQKLAKVIDRLLRHFAERPASALPQSLAVGEDKEDDISDDEVVAPTTTDDADRVSRRSEQHESKLTELRGRIRDYLSKDGDSLSKRYACFIWFHVELREHLRGDPVDLSPALKFLREWFLQTAHHLSWRAIDDRLDECFWLAACVLGLHSPSADRVHLHEALESYLPEPVPPGLLATPPLVPVSFARLIPAGTDPLAGVAAILAARTCRQEIRILMECAAANPPHPPTIDLQICQNGDGKKIRERLATRKKVAFREITSGSHACPHEGCYLTLRDSLYETLGRQRFVICTNCERVITDLSSRP
jgi:hypothetical protein